MNIDAIVTFHCPGMERDPITKIYPIITANSSDDDDYDDMPPLEEVTEDADGDNAERNASLMRRFPIYSTVLPLLPRRNTRLVCVSSMTSPITKDGIVQLGKSMMGPEQTLPIYKTFDPSHAFTLLTIQGQHISFEGVPCVGKTTLMHSMQVALRDKGAEVDAHEEDSDAEMLAQFFLDPERYAFWFQMFKLRGRQQRAQIHENALHNGNRKHVTYLEDRDLPGDMAFALYNYLKGNINEDQIRVYMREATKINFQQPFLTLYLTAPPTRLRENVVMRGNTAEIGHYTEQYFKDMDLCYRAALEICGCTYCIVEWGDAIPGVGAAGSWGPHHGLVPAQRCFEVLEAAIAAAYGPNIVRIHQLHDEMNDSKRIVLSPGSGRSLRGSDPSDLVQEMDRILARPVTEYCNTGK